MEPVEYTYYEETADDDSANEVAAPQTRESSASASSSSNYTSSSSSEEQEDESDQDEQGNDEEGNQDDDEEPQAPSFAIPSRTISAVEHPFLVMNIDKALDSFGPNPQYDSVILNCLFLKLMTIILTFSIDFGSQCASALSTSLSSPQGPYF